MALTGLKGLNLSGNAFGAEELEVLAPAVQAVSGLQRLSLSGSTLAVEGTAAAPLILTLLDLLLLQSLDLGSASSAWSSVATCCCSLVQAGAQPLDLAVSRLRATIAIGCCRGSRSTTSSSRASKRGPAGAEARRMVMMVMVMMVMMGFLLRWDGHRWHPEEIEA